MQKVAILGATGSIGRSALDVITRHPQDFKVTLLVANKSVECMYELVQKFQPRYVALLDPLAASRLRSYMSLYPHIHVLDTLDLVCQVLKSDEVDTVVAAIVGAAGLKPTLSAVQAGKRILLANKESLVMTGRLFMQEAYHSNAQILPVDSEHNAIFQCLPLESHADLGRHDLADFGIERVLLTGSGGPFLKRDPASMQLVTPSEACNHPNWSMGPKISVDSATMMNKGLEYIEARWLFNLSASQIDIIVHPQSVIHSMVQFTDGSTLAQLGQADMRTPLAHCLSYPKRCQAGVEALDFTRLGSLNFFAPDFNQFPNLKLAIDACSAGQAATTILNASNEEAVQAFLDERIGFLDIAAINQSCLDRLAKREAVDLESVLELDEEARVITQSFIN
tara:strand:+ start:35838 stop:37019 length:1182 start_codon:yes stop_codon:yes gene_type:complete